MKLFWSSKKLIDKTKNGENISSIEVFEVVLVQCNLANNQYQEESYKRCHILLCPITPLLIC